MLSVERRTVSFSVIGRRFLALFMRFCLKKNTEMHHFCVKIVQFTNVVVLLRR